MEPWFVNFYENVLRKLRPATSAHAVQNASMQLTADSQVGTVDGGIILASQRACLESLECAGPTQQDGMQDDSIKLTTNDLVSSHMKLSRSKLQLYGGEPGKQTQFTREVEKAGGSMRLETHAKNKLKPLTGDFV
ncbi:unnamed protein product [Caenorhabditis brenneri]